MKIVQTEPRPHKLVLTQEEAKFLCSIYNLTIELESATMYTVPREDIFEQFVVACAERADEEEIISIDLDSYYEEA